MDVLDSIKEQIRSNAIILYMKGSPQAPQCRLSAQTVQCLMACGERFAYVDVLQQPGCSREPAGLRELADIPAVVGRGRTRRRMRHRHRDVPVGRTEDVDCRCGRARQAATPATAAK